MSAEGPTARRAVAAEATAANSERFRRLPRDSAVQSVPLARQPAGSEISLICRSDRRTACAICAVFSHNIVRFITVYRASCGCVSAASGRYSRNSRFPEQQPDSVPAPEGHITQLSQYVGVIRAFCMPAKTGTPNQPITTKACRNRTRQATYSAADPHHRPRT